MDSDTIIRSDSSVSYGDDRIDSNKIWNNLETWWRVFSNDRINTLSKLLIGSHQDVKIISMLRVQLLSPMD